MPTHLPLQMSQKANETISLQEKFEAQINLASRVEEDLLAKKSQVCTRSGDGEGM